MQARSDMKGTDRAPPSGLRRRTSEGVRACYHAKEDRNRLPCSTRPQIDTASYGEGGGEGRNVGCARGRDSLAQGQGARRSSTESSEEQVAWMRTSERPSGRQSGLAEQRLVLFDVLFASLLLGFHGERNSRETRNGSNPGAGPFLFPSTFPPNFGHLPHLP